MKIRLGFFEIIIRRNKSDELTLENIRALAESDEVKKLFCKSDFCEFAYDDDQDQDYRCYLHKGICFDRRCKDMIEPKL